MHFTLQFFFSLLAGFVLGGRLGALSVGIYLLIGLCGVPVFASGGGPSYLLKPTFGFLLGFVFAAGVTGWLSEKFPPQKIWGYLFISTAGFAVMYLSGNLYFYFVSNYVIHVPVSWKLVLINCFFLTAAGDYLLCILASITARRLLILKKRYFPTDRYSDWKVFFYCCLFILREVVFSNSCSRTFNLYILLCKGAL